MSVCECVSHTFWFHRWMRNTEIPFTIFILSSVGGSRCRNLLFMISQLVIASSQQPNADSKLIFLESNFDLCSENTNRLILWWNWLRGIHRFIDYFRSIPIWTASRWYLAVSMARPIQRTESQHQMSCGKYALNTHTHTGYRGTR